jgi:hypothetical protein
VSDEALADDSATRIVKRYARGWASMRRPGQNRRNARI